MNNKSESRACRQRLLLGPSNPKSLGYLVLSQIVVFLEKAMDELREWVQQKITEFDLDVEVYTSYVMGIVAEETTDVSEKQAAVIELLVAATVS